MVVVFVVGPPSKLVLLSLNKTCLWGRAAVPPAALQGFWLALIFPFPTPRSRTAPLRISAAASGWWGPSAEHRGWRALLRILACR